MVREKGEVTRKCKAKRKCKAGKQHIDLLNTKVYFYPS